MAFNRIKNIFRRQPRSTSSVATLSSSETVSGYIKKHSRIFFVACTNRYCFENALFCIMVYYYRKDPTAEKACLISELFLRNTTRSVSAGEAFFENIEPVNLPDGMALATKLKIANALGVNCGMPASIFDEPYTEVCALIVRDNITMADKEPQIKSYLTPFIAELVKKIKTAGFEPNSMGVY